MDNLPTPSDGHRVAVNIEEEMRGSYLAYAMSVIIGRALPDVRDGLKPVHRRVLYAMYEQKNSYNSAYKKSARIVGDVIGKYHPHGDQAVYDTIVRMAQPFSLRYVLVDGQGNFGSVDGDPAAAMRYTEIRMTRLAGEMLNDIEKETIDWQDNYDGSEQEPTVLPAGFPQLLVNGSGGIAVGMATNMPPHNLHEVIQATIAVIEDPDIDVLDLLQIIPGPDFPTGGYIFGRQGIFEAYTTGRGKIQVRAKADIEYDEKGDEKAIAVTELPYQVNKARLLETIAELVRDKKIEGIRDLRDESDRTGMRIYIELKKGAMAQIVLNKLFAMTQMQTTFGIINLAIVQGQPRVLALKELITHFVNHRRDVVTRRTRYELRKAEERIHILEGYLKALANIDEVIAIIKASASPAEARAGLMARFELSEVQAQSILDLRLQRLTAMEVEKIEEEYREVLARITWLKGILADDGKLMALIVEELRAIDAQYTDPRRTEIVNASGEIGIEDLIADDDMVVTVTSTGYIKRTPLVEYRTQRRGGKGRSGMSTKDADDVTNMFVASSHTLLLIFTDRGQVYPLKVWELPRSGMAATGKAIVNLIQLEDGETVRTILPVESLDDPECYLVFATHQGTVKRTAITQYKNIRKGGIRAIILGEEDDLVEVRLATERDHVMLVTAHGQAIVFAVPDARAVGRAAQGVRGIRLRKDDSVVAMDIVNLEGEAPEDEVPSDDDAAVEVEDAAAVDDDDDDSETQVDESTPTVVLVTEKGYGKRTPLELFRIQRRGGLGLRALPYSARNGALVAMCQVKTDDDLMLVTDGGTIIRLPVAEIRAYSRAAKGVRIINLSNEKVVSINPVPASEEEEDDAVIEGAEGLGAGESESESEDEGLDGLVDETPGADADAREPSGDDDGE
ncbi:MAG: DNA gyrase subunit A [Deltaproteobacteria bacterium]|nr:DNA gyrase subunit A [Deltaproteobacteria bacterium]